VLCGGLLIGLGWAGLLYGFDGLKPVHWLAVLVRASGNIEAFRAACNCYSDKSMTDCTCWVRLLAIAALEN